MNRDDRIADQQPLTHENSIRRILLVKLPTNACLGDKQLIDLRSNLLPSGPIQAVIDLRKFPRGVRPQGGWSHDASVSHRSLRADLGGTTQPRENRSLGRMIVSASWTDLRLTHALAGQGCTMSTRLGT